MLLIYYFQAYFQETMIFFKCCGLFFFCNIQRHTLDIKSIAENATGDIDRKKSLKMSSRNTLSCLLPFLVPS